MSRSRPLTIAGVAAPRGHVTAISKLAMNDQIAGSPRETQGIQVGRLPADHVRILHSRAWAGRVAVAEAARGWRETAVPLADLPRYVADLGGHRDAYLSQARFWPRRRVSRLVTVGSLWVDLDYYRIPSLAGRRPGDVAGDVLRETVDRGILPPSYQVSTGRGLLAVWLHEELPPAALPRWRLAQRALLSRFRGYGADAAAADATHVFRLWGSVSGRSGSAIAPVDGRDPPLVHRFDDLAADLLPYTRAEIAAMRIRPRNRRGQELFPAGLGRDLTAPANLWGRRMEDLKALRELRWWEGMLPPGQRDHWLFIASLALSWMASPARVRREVLELGRIATGGAWSPQQILTDMGMVIQRAEAAARGETVEWNGGRVDPRYRMRTETIRRWLAITPEEELAAGLRTLVSPDRLTELQVAKGRLSGQVRRRKAATAAQEVRQLREEGMTYREIAEVLGCSKSRIPNLLSIEPV